MEVNMGGRGSSSASANSARAASATATPQDKIAAIAYGIGGSNYAANQQIIDVLRTAGINVDGVDSQKLSSNFDTDALAGIATEIITLEQEYGALELNNQRGGSKKNLSFSSDRDVYGSASPIGSINVGVLLGDMDKRLASLSSEQNSGFKVKTAQTRENATAYTPIHEYGHIISMAIFKKEVNNGTWSYWSDGDFHTWCGAKRQEIMSIAEKKYGYTGGVVKQTKSGKASKAKSSIAGQVNLVKNLSEYGASKRSEFFSEAFVQYKIGSGDKSLGYALRDWISDNLA